MDRQACVLTSVRGYYDSSSGRVAGRAYGTEASGIRAATASEFDNPDAFILSNGSGANRYPVRGATDAGDVAGPLPRAAAEAVLEETFEILSRARAHIRPPPDRLPQVPLSVVAQHGHVLGLDIGRATCRA